VTADRRSRRAAAVSFLSAIALNFALSGCSDDAATCKSSADCAPSQICGAPGNGPYHCLDACGQDGTCRAGYTCDYVVGADCPVCAVVIRACVVAPRLQSRL
jgi:hypothetical protein